MEGLLKELLTELELKEEHCAATRNPYPPDKDKGQTGRGLNSASTLLPKRTQPMGSGGGNMLLTTQTVTSPTFHRGALGRVTLQTAQAVVRGNNESVRVRVLFQAGSHRSFITT